MANHAPTLAGHRQPETTPLYQVVQRHWLTFLDMTEQDGRGLPQYVRDEFRRYLDCGIWAHGFVRSRCADCGYDRLVPTCCKGRSWCPCCVGRTMNATAALLTDHVIADVPVRHWVLTLPPPLRYLCAYDTELCSVVTRAFSRSLSSHLRHQAKDELGLSSVNQAHVGAVTAIQRASSNLSLNPHLHTIAAEGVWLCDGPDGEPAFRALPAPTRATMASVAWATCKRVLKALRQRGLWLDMEPGEDTLAQNEPALAKMAAASVQGVLMLGNNAGKRVMRLFGSAGREREGQPSDQAASSQHTPGYGFNVYAGRRVSASDRKGREALCRYLLRPPLSQRRLALREDGNVLLKMKRAYADGTEGFVFEPLEFLGRLAALVFPPRMHRIRYCGVWAPNAKLRAKVIPKPPPSDQDGCCGHGGDGKGSGGDRRKSTPERPKSQRKYYSWAALMKRVFARDVLTCPKCGEGPVQQVALITRADAIRKILACVGLPADSPRLNPSTYPVQMEMFG